ncbi:MAG TPA: PilN domain-containing protein [Burkholderiales bacterium]|nr:PilN domain-containing protein [Burkholderiales bacterium]
MKITTNLIITRPRLALPLAAAVWGLGLVLIVFAIVLTVAAVESNTERPNLEVRLTRLNEQLTAAAPKQPLPPDTELVSMRQRVGTFNSIASTRGMTPVQMLSWIEKSLPEKVYLASLHHRPRDGEMLLVAEAPTAEPLTVFLLQLEKEPRFKEVLLSKQGTRKGQGAATVQFEIRVREKL